MPSFDLVTYEPAGVDHDSSCKVIGSCSNQVDERGEFIWTKVWACAPECAVLAAAKAASTGHIDTSVVEAKPKRASGKRKGSLTSTSPISTMPRRFG